MTGSLGVLNVGAGDIEVRFNQHQPEELERALRMLQDMVKRGYAILVRLEDGSYTRAIDIDATRGLYVISDVPPIGELDTVVEGQRLTRAGTPDKRYRKGYRRRVRRVPIAQSHAVAVARSAGG